ncbi:MAG: hypothetical protein DRJ67_12625 [Thermoprotei archaeon]|nr:MAG: hypothetical protein DRJ67_12625 [Thermoprotei archaeon]
MALTAYVADMELLGVLIFSGEQRPAVAEPGGAVITASHFIHNYPLIYGLNNRPVESYAVIPSLHFLSYNKLRESKHVSKLAAEPLKYTFVEEQIRKLLRGERAVYAFPAYPERVYVRKFFMAAKGFGYAEFRGRLKTVYPRLEHYVALIPPSRFRTVVFSTLELPPTIYIRIGMKRMGLFRVRLHRARIVGRVEGLAWTSVPVNLHDVSLFGYAIYDAVKLLETRSKPPEKPMSSIIGYVKTDKLAVIAHEGERLRVPVPPLTP